MSDDALRSRIVSHEEIAEAVLIPAMHVLAIDCAVEDAEIQQLKNLCDMSPIYKTLDPAERDRVIARISADMAEDPAAQVTKVARLLPVELRETAYAFAARVAAADGGVSEVEMQMLTDLASQLGLEPARVNHIFEVVEILQRPLPPA
ncbi:MAG: TerB family tellurite resistance protein [Pseudomonadota bacterium]